MFGYGACKPLRARVPMPAGLMGPGLLQVIAPAIVLLWSMAASAGVGGDEEGLSPSAMAIRFYQKYISDLRYGNCRFDPSCSQFAMEAIEAKGFLLGSALAADRLIRCNSSARHFHSRGPDGRLTDPVGTGPAGKVNPEIPAWLVPVYADPPPLAGVTQDTSRAGGTAEAGGLAEYAGFADALAEMGDCDRAATEYLRVAYLGQTRELRFWAQMRIGTCLYSNGSWSAAGSEFGEAAASAVSTGDRNLARFMAAGSAFNALDYEGCRALLSRLDLSEVPDRLTCAEAERAGAEVTGEHHHFLSGLCLMALEDWDGAGESFGRVQTACPGSPNRERAVVLGAKAMVGRELPRRSPAAASLFSTVVPGTGQMYAGRFTDGLRHLFFNGLLGYTIYWLIREENYTGAYLVGGITLPFYVGNIVGAGRSADWFNASKRAEHIRDAIDATE